MTPTPTLAPHEALRLADAICDYARYGFEDEQQAQRRRMQSHKDAAAELRRLHSENESLRAQAAERAVPAGVTEPTNEMYRAAQKIELPYDDDNGAIILNTSQVRAIWQAMLAASPAQPAAQQETLGVRCGLSADDESDPTHPRYVAGFKAGHAAGRKRADEAQPAPAQDGRDDEWIAERHVALKRFHTHEFTEGVHTLHPDCISNALREGLARGRAAAPVAAAGGVPPRAYAGRERGAWEHGFAAGLAAAPQPPAPAEETYIEQAQHLNCPVCGGSGHIDDIAPSGDAARRALIELVMLKEMKDEWETGELSGFAYKSPENHRIHNQRRADYLSRQPAAWEAARSALAAAPPAPAPAGAADALDAARLEFLCSTERLRMIECEKQGFWRVYQDEAPAEAAQHHWQAMTSEWHPTARAAIDAARARLGEKEGT